MTEKITNKEARKDFGKIAPFVLIVNIVFAIGIFAVSGNIFNQESAYLGTILAIAFLAIGIFSFVILKLMSKKATRVDRVSKDK
jgi:hypothetical protein